MTQKKRHTKRLTPEAQAEVDKYLSSKEKKSKMDILNLLERNFRPTKKQQEFCKVIDDNSIIICHGSAGTGKTMTAVYKGLHTALKNNMNLVLIRPIFESASEKIGFLPGELEEKLAPHARAFKYVLAELVGDEAALELLKSGRITFEVLNYLRGATIPNAIIICDEAQNMTVDEMMLAVTRIGKGSKVILTGDFYQSDLRKAKGSIMELSKLLEPVNGVSKFTFVHADNMRNEILKEITAIWEDYKKEKGL